MTRSSWKRLVIGWVVVSLLLNAPSVCLGQCYGGCDGDEDGGGGLWWLLLILVPAGLSMLEGCVQTQAPAGP